MIDTHCHFPPGTDIAAVLGRARSAGVSVVMAMGGNPEDDAGALEAARLAPDMVRTAVGCYPDRADMFSAGEKLSSLIEDLRARAAAPHVRAIGEIGLDYSHGELPETRRAQREVSPAEVRLAAELDLPCSIHSRKAQDDTVAILRECASPARVAARTVGSIHCFTASLEFAERLMPFGVCFGLSGVFTFRNADPLRGVVARLPRELLISETDSPYLTPVPLRGRPNEPAFVAHTVAKLAETLGVSVAEADALTESNARRVFAP